MNTRRSIFGSLRSVLPRSLATALLAGLLLPACDPEFDPGTQINSLRVLAVDPTSGKLAHDVETFRQTKPIGKNTKNSYASPTPVVDDALLAYAGSASPRSSGPP